MTIRDKLEKLASFLGKSHRQPSPQAQTPQIDAAVLLSRIRDSFTEIEQILDAQRQNDALKENGGDELVHAQATIANKNALAAVLKDIDQYDAQFENIELNVSQLTTRSEYKAKTLIYGNDLSRLEDESVEARQRIELDVASRSSP